MEGREEKRENAEPGAAEPARDLFETPPPPPIPETLREKPGAGSTGKDGGSSGYGDMTKAWGAAMDFVFTIIGAALLGYFADRWQGTSPRYTLIGLVAGFALSLYRIIRRTLADEKREQERKKGGTGGPR